MRGLWSVGIAGVVLCAGLGQGLAQSGPSEPAGAAAASPASAVSPATVAAPVGSAAAPQSSPAPAAPVKAESGAEAVVAPSAPSSPSPPVVAPVPAPSGEKAAPSPSERPAPYSLPWGLRPIVPVTVLRLDSVIAMYRAADSQGVTAAVLPLVGYRFTPHFMGVLRWGVIGNAAPDGTSGVSVPNLALGGIWGLKLPAGFRLGMFLGATVPIGTGGARSADPLTAAATSAGLYARSALDNAMFAVNDFTLFPGIDFAYVGHGLTVQIEATVLQLMRVKNEAVQPDAFRTNFTAGLHIGYFVTRWLTLTSELRYQRWLSSPEAVAADETLRDNLSLAIGPRFHAKIGRGFLRPGIAYNVGLEGRLNTNSYHMVLLDLPYVL